MSTRAERRRKERGGNQPPGRRDPMTAVYIGLAVVIVLILAGFGIASYLANHKTSSAAAFDLSTPTPGPNAKSKAIQLFNDKAVGAVGFRPTPNPNRGILSDTPLGGKGQIVDGIPCETQEQVAVHVHSHLALFVKGKQIEIPAYIGMAPSMGGGCLYWLHTHDPTGIIHVEAGSPESPNGGPFTLGNFFDIWGQQLNRNQVGTFKGNVTAYLNGVPYGGDLNAIPLRSHQLITLEVGTPVVPPPRYEFPAGD